MYIALAIITLAVSVFAAIGFWKAGRFKSKASKEVLLAAGFGWVKEIPLGLVRLIAWLEILGALGAVVAPAGAYVTGFVWSQYVGIAAAAGLAMTMVAAFIMHVARKEAKYTWKKNLSLFALATAAAILQSLVVLPLF